MDLVSNLLLGFENALSLTNLIYCFIGVTVGTLIGVLPGIGPVATIAMLLPITYTLDPLRCPHHACRYLLRRSVRRLHHRDSREYSG